MVAAFCCGVVSNSYSQNEVIILTDNPSDKEYVDSIYAMDATYMVEINKKAPRCWRRPAYLGNNVNHPSYEWSQEREGLGLSGFAMWYNFDGHDCFGGGLELNYIRQYYGGYVYGAITNGFEARTSERYGEQFSQLHAGAGLLGPSIEIPVFRTSKRPASILRLIPYGEINFKKAKDLKTDGGSSTTTSEDDEYWYITTTNTNGKLDAQPHVWGWEAGLRIQLDFEGTRWGLFGQVGYGKSQNFTYSEAQWHNAAKGRLGLVFRLNPKTTTNTRLKSYLGL